MISRLRSSLSRRREREPARSTIPHLTTQNETPAGRHRWDSAETRATSPQAIGGEPQETLGPTMRWELQGDDAGLAGVVDQCSSIAGKRKRPREQTLPDTSDTHDSMCEKPQRHGSFGEALMCSKPQHHTSSRKRAKRQDDTQTETRFEESGAGERRASSQSSAASPRATPAAPSCGASTSTSTQPRRRSRRSTGLACPRLTPAAQSSLVPTSTLARALGMSSDSPSTSTAAGSR